MLSGRWQGRYSASSDSWQAEWIEEASLLNSLSLWHASLMLPCHWHHGRSVHHAFLAGIPHLSSISGSRHHRLLLAKVRVGVLGERRKQLLDRK